MGATARIMLLMVTLTVFLLAIGYVVGYFIGNMMLVLTIAFVMAVVLNITTYWFADRWVLKLYKARLVTESEDPDLHKMVERLSTNAGLSKPKVAVIPTQAPNAFATGRNPAHAVVAVTDGARSLLDEDQLEGVLGHEMAHIKNRDMLINTMAAVIAGAIAYIGFAGRFSLFFGGGRRGGGASILALLAMILLPIAAGLIRLSVSRTREYGADRSGASISRKPRALASALLTIQSAVKNKPMRSGSPSTSHLFIVNPFRGTSFSELFSTHPLTEKRVQRLEEMARTGNF